jgi:hypothetical protein
VNSVGSNPVNEVVSTVISFGAILDGGFGSTGWLLKVEIIHVDYEACNDLYDGDIFDNSRATLAPIRVQRTRLDPDFPHFQKL